MFKLRLVFLKYSLIVNLMPAAHLKEVGTGASYHCVTSHFL